MSREGTIKKVLKAAKGELLLLLAKKKSSSGDFLFYSSSCEMHSFFECKLARFESTAASRATRSNGNATTAAAIVFLSKLDSIGKGNEANLAVLNRGQIGVAKSLVGLTWL